MLDPNCEENISQDSDDSDDEECKKQQITLEEELILLVNIMQCIGRNLEVIIGENYLKYI